MLKIGISSCFLYEDVNRLVFSPKMLCYLENDMARFISQKGVIPVLIPDLPDNLLFELLDEMDGFLFQGGNDVAPSSYGEDLIENGRWPGDPYRDQYELKLMSYALKSGKPILGICRGCQILNVALGGSLFQDTFTQKPNVNIHRSAEEYDKKSHLVSFVRGTTLDKLYEDVQGDIKVNTIHHQSINQLGNDLEVIAISPNDGVIEAIEYTKGGEGMVMGVQWHPEFSHTLQDEVIDEKRLINHFLDKVSMRKK